MNIIKRIFATAFVFSALLLGWVYLLGSLTPEESANPMWKESLNSLNDLYRISYRQSRNTLQQASLADEDSLCATATIMRAIAESERINCRICQQAIESLGDKVSAPSLPQTDLMTSHSFVEQKISQKSILNQTTLPKIIDKLLLDENRYIARLLTWYNSNNNQQLLLLEFCRADQAPHSPRNITSRANAYYVCPTCGYITLYGLTPHCCPQCMTRSREFILFK